MAFEEAQMPLLKTFGAFTVRPKIIKFAEVLNSVYISWIISMKYWKQYQTNAQSPSKEEINLSNLHFETLFVTVTKLTDKN